MERKEKQMSKGKREILLFLERILAIGMVVIVAFVFANSFLSVSTNYKTTYHYVISPLDKEASFENRKVFRDLLKGNTEKLIELSALRSQMESNGVYNPKKEVDVTEWLRILGEAGGEQKVSATYYLEDLIKWGNYGFEYQTKTGTWQELNAMLRGNDGISTEKVDKLQGTGTKYAMELLVNRYRTVDGKELNQCVFTVEDYEALKANVETLATILFENYSKYMELLKLYGNGQTNLYYCVLLEQDGKPVYLTNTNFSFQGMNGDDIGEQMQTLGERNLVFDPSKMQMNTNTGITASEMRTIVKKYNNTFGDNSKLWITVDTKYPAKDDLYYAKERIDKFMPYYWQTLATAVGAFLIWLLLIVYLCKQEGKVLTPEGEMQYTIKKSDHFFFEIWFVLIVALEIFCVMVALQLVIGFVNGTVRYPWLPAIFGVLALMANEGFLSILFTSLRRIKAKKLWKTTFVYHIIDVLQKMAKDTYDNGSVASRTWIPYLIFLMGNLILVLLGVGGILGAFLLDLLVGAYLYRENKARKEIVAGIETIKNGEVNYQVDTKHLHGDNLILARSVNTIGASIRNAVETSMKDERMKADLITNVSHDIKTPLTSIITYVDLLKRENIQDEKIASYIAVLDTKSQRLKQLTDDLVEASKISSGNVSIQLMPLDFSEMIRQALGEFYEKFEEKGLQVLSKLPEEPAMIEADPRHLFRVMENLFTNVYKYGLDATRVYVELEKVEKAEKPFLQLSIKNISQNPLDKTPEELLERFMRGDDSRKTEGSGLGLSIAKNLVESQAGQFHLEIDGDLFKAYVSFPEWKEEA